MTKSEKKIIKSNGRVIPLTKPDAGPLALFRIFLKSCNLFILYKIFNRLALWSICDIVPLLLCLEMHHIFKNIHFFGHYKGSSGTSLIKLEFTSLLLKLTTQYFFSCLKFIWQLYWPIRIKHWWVETMENSKREIVSLIFNIEIDFPTKEQLKHQKHSGL